MGGDGVPGGSDGLTAAAAEGTETAPVKRVGLFGGSFNPPHMGHVLACHYALCRWNLDLVVVMPSFRHPFNKAVEPYVHRTAMAELAFEHLGDWVEVSRLEEELEGVSYTVDVIRELLSRHPDWKLHLVVGGDIVGELDQWKEAGEVRRLAEPLVIPRLKGGEVLGGGAREAALPDVSSTTLREALAEGTDMGGMLPASVLEYIRSAGLFLK